MFSLCCRQTDHTFSDTLLTQLFLLLLEAIIHYYHSHPLITMKWFTGVAFALVASPAAAMPIPQDEPQSYDTRQDQRTLYKLRVQALVPSLPPNIEIFADMT
jgi:hypothetical protein